MRELIEAIERGEFPHGMNGAARQVFPYHEDARADLGLTAAAAFDGSVDAALALMQAVLPPPWVAVVMTANERMKPGAMICKVVDGTVHANDEFKAEADTPARALLLAILKAMEQTKAKA